MKNIITLIPTLFLITLTFTANAQLNGLTHEESAGYKTVFEVKSMSIPSRGCIRYSHGTYFLCGSTDNQFEDTYATIYLGDDKESAILSLEDLRKIVSKEIELPKSGLVVKDVDGKRTTLYKRFDGMIYFKSEYVAGETYVLYTMRNKFDAAKQAILNFNDGSESPMMSSAVQESTPTKESTKAAELESELEELNKEISQNDETIKTLTAKNKELKKQANRIENLLRERWRLD